jgi:microcystin-dependent protein
MFGGNFAPAGWMFCAGQTLPISENETLFQLIGTTYGGDGQSTFNLPDLQSRLPIHQGTAPSGATYQLAETGGSETVTLTVQQLPTHSHPFVASGDVGNSSNPANQVLGAGTNVLLFRGIAPDTQLAPGVAITPTGGSQPHTNDMPYLAISFIISLFGIFPSPT